SSEAGSWAARKKATRGLWPPGKSEPSTGIDTSRPQPVTTARSGPTASSAISALNAPQLLPSQQMANGNGQSNGVARNQAHGEPAAILHLLPMNGTFERKTITVPYYPEVIRIGRQTNQKTIPTPANGFFDSKVLSRQHAEVWADRQGRIFIRDVKSSNGTFVNGMRLSQENKESEPRELHEQDVLELGIDIVSEDQKTVVHHKVAAKVEHAGIYGQGNNDPLNFGDLDPSMNGGLMAAPHPMKRTGSQGSI
ncbi:SMAD/FHA domain-containing protein, partial [Teratosphaeria nubilosa]